MVLSKLINILNLGMLMQHEFYVQIFKNLIGFIICLLFYFISTIFIISNVQANLKNNFRNITFKQDYFFKKNIYKDKLFNNCKEQSNAEVIVVNSSKFSYLPIVFTFSPMKYLQSSDVTDVTDYLKTIPGFSSVRSGGVNSDLVFRGMFGSQLRTLMDNGEIFGACCSRMDPANSYICIDTFDILNIIKGPQTVLLGPVASGGVLQFERYCPRFEYSEIKLRSNMMIGSNNKVNKNIDSVIGNKYGYIRLISNVAHSDDYKDGNKCQVHSAWYKWNTDAIFSLNLNLDTTCEISVGQGNGNANYAAKVMDGLCFDRENYSIKIKSMNIFNILDKIELYTWYNYVNHIMGDTVRKSIVLSGIQRCGCMDNNNVDRRLWGARGIISGQWKSIEFFSGIDTQINQHRKIGCHSKWKTDIISQDSGIFSELVFLNTLLNKKFIGGVRLEHYSVINSNFSRYKKFDTIYPAGFLRYETSIYPSLFYYVGIGTSKRFPDYWEFLSVECNDKKNSDLKDILDQQLNPERTFQLDIGTYFQVKKINGWISSYIGYTKDYILYYNNMNSKVTDYSHVSNINAKIYGTEAILEYEYNDNWCIKSNVTWARGINIANGCLLPKIPPLEGTLRCQWKKGCCNITALWRIVSGLRSTEMNVGVLSDQVILKDYINKTPGFGVLSMNFLWTSSKYYIFSMGIDNLLNRSYREYLSLNYHERLGYKNFNVPIYEPGRLWWIKTEVKL